MLPIVMAKVTVRGASGNEEVIADQRGSLGKQDPLARCTDLTPSESKDVRLP